MQARKLKRRFFGLDNLSDREHSHLEENMDNKISITSVLYYTEVI